MSAIILLRFNESAKVQPSDFLGNLSDLGTEAGIVAPARVSTWTGFGRQFVQASTNGLVAADLASIGTLLQRDVTIQALISLTLSGASGAQTIIARGTNDGTASERYAYGLEVQEQSGFPGFVEVRWFWQDSSGTIKPQAPGVFRSPGDGVEFLLTATRRWESTSRVVVRYYVDDQLIAELVSGDGDISGGTTGHTSIGTRKASGTYSRYFNGMIDELMVLDNELSIEEISHTWKRLTEYQPGGVETFAALSPPGSVWARNLGNDIGRKVKLVGELLGLVVAGAEEIRALILPDVAPLEITQRWEKICELPAGPVDSLDVRHARVLGFLAREEGFDVPTVQTALSEPMALDPSLVQIFEFTNTVTDDFSSSIGSQWFDGGGATWIASGGLGAFAAAGSDLRWETRKTPFLLQANEPGRLYVATSIATDGVSISDGNVPNGAFWGLALHNRSTLDWMWFGIINSGGDPELVWRTALNGGPPGAFTALMSPLVDGPYWIRIATSQSSGFADNGDLTLSFSYSPDSRFVDFHVNTGITRGWGWAGLAITSTQPTIASDMNVGFNDFTLHNADSLRPFVWYAYRDPALAGNPDMIGADLLVRKIRPAYTHAAAISKLSCICNDPLNGLCDHGPCA